MDVLNKSLRFTAMRTNQIVAIHGLHAQRAHFNCFISLVIFFLVISGWVTSATAQGYTFSSSAGSFVNTGATNVDEIETDNGVRHNIPIGFTFLYFGSPVTHVSAFSDGALTFSGGTITAVNDLSLAQTIIAPLWDDLNGNLGQATYITSGSAPNRIFTFQWLNWRWSASASQGGISFQVKLYETSNKIEFIYQQEPGALNSPSASIGIASVFGNSLYYSITQLGTLEPGVFNNIAAKPATGQVYTFTPSSTTFTVPTVQASSINTTPTHNTATVSWTNGNGQYRIVLVKQTHVNENLAPSDITQGRAYLANTSFGDIRSHAGRGWYCVYDGAGTSVNISNLQSGLPYRVQVLEYNGLGGLQRYNTSGATSNPVSFTTVTVRPTTPISSLFFTNKTSHWITSRIAPGNGARVAVFMKATSSGTATPIDNTIYNANPNFGSGSQIGSSGWYCVYNGSPLNFFTVLGLNPTTSYRIHAVDYNGQPGSELYFSSTSATNPIQVTTYAPVTSLPAYNFIPSSGTFTPLVGGTPVDPIEINEGLSGKIPIGFTFNYNDLDFTQVEVSSNGFLSFHDDLTNILDHRTNSLLFGNPKPLVAPLWDNLDGTGGQASYLTTGTAPNRVFTFEWLNWRWNFSANADISFQVKLYEADKRVEFLYRQETGTPSSASASIGLGYVDAGRFLSLSDASASPAVSTDTETNSIATRPATGQLYSFVPPAPQTITFSVLSTRIFGDLPFTLTASASSGLPVSFASSNTAVATVTGNTVTIVGAGAATITASQSGNLFFSSAPPVDQTLTVNKANQTITFTALPAKVFGDPNFALDATSSSGLPIIYTSSNTNIVTINGNTATIVGAGSTDITASQAGNANYNPATVVVQPFTINKANQTITLEALPVKIVGGPDFDLTASASSGLSISYTSSNAAVATVSGSTVTIIGAGVTTITASQLGSANYNMAGSVTQTLRVKLEQSIDFQALPSKTFGDAPFAINASASSGLALTFESSNTGIATINGTIVTIAGAGTTTITARQSGNTLYAEATEVIQLLVIDKASQTITFTPITAKTLGNAPFTLDASSTSGLGVSFTATSDKVSVTGNQLTIAKAGSVTVQAQQAGNANYNAAPSVSNTFCINPPQPTITITNKDVESIVLTSSATTGNQWFREDVLIPGAIGKTLTITTPGIYTVQTQEDNCFSLPSTPQAIVVTGNETIIGFEEFKVYPNPAEDMLIIESAGTAIMEVVIMDTMGRIVKTTSGYAVIQMSLHEVGSGVYNLVIEQGQKRLIKRLIKK
jgi:hypothetical protein